MFGDFLKMAAAILVISLTAVSAMKDHWFARFFPAPAAAPQAVAASHVVAGAPTPAPSHRWGTVELPPNEMAQYSARVEINGARINALVDTGATLVTLSSEDARTLNIDPPPSAFTVQSHTANGVALNAPVRLREIRIGDITVYDVDALVTQPGKLGVTLLGMSFLKKLSSFQLADGRFVMKQ